MTPSNDQRIILKLSGLVDIQRRARKASSLESLGFLMVNETMGVIPYRQAMLFWQEGQGSKIAALSGLATIEPNAPFVVWIKDLVRKVQKKDGANQILEVTKSDLGTDQLADSWEQWLPGRLLWIPLEHDGNRVGTLILARDDNWNDGDRKMADILADAYAHAVLSLLKKGKHKKAGIRKSVLWSLALAALVGIGCIPVRDSVLAPAEVIARDPEMARAPMDGTIERIWVRPNQTVRQGDVLFNLDPVRIQNQLEVARKAQEVAEVELRQAIQAAVSDPRARATVPVLSARLDQQRAEAGYLQDMLGRIQIRSSIDGIVVFDDPNEWIGRSVSTGERVLLVADPSRVELEIRLPISDAIHLETGNDVRFFLNIDPRAPVRLNLNQIGYRAQPGPDGIMDFRLKATFEESQEILRVGLKGTAKIYGGDVALAWYVFRKPLSAARRWLGY